MMDYYYTLCMKESEPSGSKKRYVLVVPHIHVKVLHCNVKGLSQIRKTWQLFFPKTASTPFTRCMWYYSSFTPFPSVELSCNNGHNRIDIIGLLLLLCCILYNDR